MYWNGTVEELVALVWNLHVCNCKHMKNIPCKICKHIYDPSTYRIPDAKIKQECLFLFKLMFVEVYTYAMEQK
jgi:hypothetical protein